MNAFKYQFIQPWKRLRFPGCEMWQCGNVIVRREHETHGLWVVVYYGNQSCHVWKTAASAKEAAETGFIVIKSHIEDVGYKSVYPFVSSASSPVEVGQEGNQ